MMTDMNAPRPELSGGPPRVIVGTYGLDQHEVGALVAARILRDAGAEVIYVGRFNLPQDLVTVAAQDDVDVIGVSCHSWEFIGYTAELLQLISAADLDVRVVLGGAIITPDDAAELEASGVAGIVGPGAPVDEIVATIWRATADRRAASSLPA